MMKFSVDAKAFRNALNKVCKAVDPKFLDSVMLKAENGNLTIIGTNFEFRITISIPVDIEQSGECSLSSKQLKSAVKGVKGKVDVSGDGSIVLSESGTSLSVDASDDFPSEVDMVEPKSDAISIPAKELAHHFGRVQFVPSYHMPHHDMVFMDFGKGKIVATDGCRLSMVQVGMGDDDSVDHHIFLPTQAVKVIQSLAGKSKSDCKVGIGEHFASFAFDNVIVETRLQNSHLKPTAYDSLFPAHYKNEAFIPHAELADALDVVAKYLDKKDINQHVKMTLGENGCLDLEIKDVKIPFAGTYKGEEIVFAFCPKYLLELVKNVKCNFTMKFNDSDKPVLFTNDDFSYLLMPMRK